MNKTMDEAVYDLTQLLQGACGELEELVVALKDDPDLSEKGIVALDYLRSSVARVALLGVALTPSGRPIA